MNTEYALMGIVFCLTQSAMFSGLNLAFFGLSRLQLEVEAETNPKAARVLSMRADSNFLLTTILWGNVGINVLLTLITDSILAGVSAFLMSTVLITFFGEIVPQAYFSRNSLRMASLLAPVLKMYQFLLFPVAKPTAMMLDWWLGKESAQFFHEHVIRDMLVRHLEAEDSDVGLVEGVGALNFLDIDDLAASDEGESVDPSSIVALDTDIDLPRFPDFGSDHSDEFLKQINASGKKWVILTDQASDPKLLLDADGFLRQALLEPDEVKPYDFCHRPIILRNVKTSLGEVIRMLRRGKRDQHGVMELDVVLVWGKEPRIITGADLLDRLLHGIR
jgi:metal transporter CNNM